MPFRIDPEKYPNRAKVQFTTSSEMPSLIHKACQVSGHPSNTVYIQHAVCEALSRDLGIPVEDLKSRLPNHRPWRRLPVKAREGVEDDG